MTGLLLKGLREQTPVTTKYRSAALESIFQGAAGIHNRLNQP
jgi:hypothetical protein